MNLLVKHLFNTITVDDLIRPNGKGGYQVRGVELKSEDIHILKDDARVFRESIIWKVLKMDMQQAANERMFEKATAPEDLIFGKAMLYTLDVMERKMQSLQDLRTVKNL